MRSDGVVTDPLRVETDWRIAAVADVDGDAKSDFIFQHRTEGWLVVWFMNNERRTGSALMHPDRTPPGWRVVAADDFTGDGRADLLFHHETDGWLVLWEMQGLQRQAGFLLTPSRVLDRDWRVASVKDINADGSPDIIWHHREHGWITAWRMNGLTRVDGVTMVPGRIPDTGWLPPGSR